MEISGQIIKRYKSSRYYQVNNHEKSLSINQYLKFVNHYRDSDYKNKGQGFTFNRLPENFEEDSIYIFSCYGKCNSKTKKYQLLIQGDSWSEGLDRNINYLAKLHQDINVISAGTTSFSPSNIEAQLGYFMNLDYSFDNIVSFIDQSDIGDEFYRYKEQTIEKTSNSSSIVKPFSTWKHTQYYNYNHDFKITSGLEYIVNSLYRISGINRAASYEKISSPLRGDNHEAVLYFQNRLISYIEYVLKGEDTKNLILVSHDHYQHLDGEYTVSVEKIISDVISNINLAETKLKLHHIHINPLKMKFCKEEDCSDYYVKGDLFSHPKKTSYKFIANEIKIKLSEINSIEENEKN